MGHSNRPADFPHLAKADTLALDRRLETFLPCLHHFYVTFPLKNDVCDGYFHSVIHSPPIAAISSLLCYGNSIRALLLRKERSDRAFAPMILSANHVQYSLLGRSKMLRDLQRSLLATDRRSPATLSTRVLESWRGKHYGGT